MTDRERIGRLLVACEIYHDALDQAFALLIQYSRATKRDSIEPFFPSRSELWPKMNAARAVYDNVKREVLDEERSKQ